MFSQCVTKEARNVMTEGYKREEWVNWRAEKEGGYEQRSLSQYGGQIFLFSRQLVKPKQEVVVFGNMKHEGC